MIAILNENSASDGDIFPYMFREAGWVYLLASEAGAALSVLTIAAR
jgi:C-terminal processing protease CtpA/Prc